MKKCSKCNISFNIDDMHCPLCGNKLSGTCEDIIFPKDNYYITRSLLLKSILTVSILIFVISLITEKYFLNTMSISFLVGGFLIANYILIYYVLKNFDNILELIGKNGILINVLLIILFLYTGNKLITNYVIPLVCIFELIFNLIAFLILKKKYIFNYLKVFLLNIILLFIPIVLNLLRWCTNNYFSYLCLVFGIVSLGAIIIFYFDELREELKKIFNN
ncbi:MAG: DUF6320 domain-containing protein [Bacilli bacterium]|nr:DUF6320 domain-containing protein [Bacilli bacterium]